ncbi:MAG: transcription elongation factor [Crenarchaeota archaeon]|nr:transcription elongation factor [Thermoproteota archaeon]
MGRRRRRRKIITRRPSLPTVFQCPNCGAHALIIEIVQDKKKKERIAKIRCASCGLVHEEPVESPIIDRAVVYGRFIDKFYAGEIRVPEGEEEE